MSGPILKHLLNCEREYGPLSQAAAAGQDRWTHWALARDEHEVAWLLFDQQDSSVNVLSEEVLLELGEILERIEGDLPQGLVVRSAKGSNFCVGADIREFRDPERDEDLIIKLEAAHAVADRLDNLSCPSVAVIHGNCLGGGLELALCCRYRLGLADARMGLPEVLLGLHPGLGGTDRLTRLIDPVKAMTMMLTGKSLDARRARAAGLIDEIVEERHVARAIRTIMKDEFRRHKSGLKGRLLSTVPARRLLARRMRAKSAEKVSADHYPAPQALISLWEEYGGDAAAMRHEEIRSFARLLTGPTAQNLMRVFFLRERLKGATADGAAGISRVHVIGAGAMGGDIAGWCALQGLHVSLHDTRAEMVAQAIRRTVEMCRAKHLSKTETRQVLDRLVPDLRNRGVGLADLVIEAVPEKLAVKHDVYRQIEPLLRRDALLATNTSGIPLEELARVLDDPGRFVGLHFFNPVARMQLIEVVEHPGARQAALDRATAFVGRIDRLPAAVSSSPGFLVNRVLTPYLMEAVLMLDEGFAAEVIDRSAENFGMPVGPVELADQVGLDICLDVAGMLREHLGQSMAPVPRSFLDRVEKGLLGRKSGQGFYLWKDGKPQKERKTVADDAEILDRLLLPMLNACMACLREGVIADEELLDGAMVFGTGFAPFRGGPMHYARHRGIDEIVLALTRLAEKHGTRFAPDPGWSDRP